VSAQLKDLVRDRYGLAVEVHGNLSVELASFEEHLGCVAARYLGANRSADAELALVASLHTNDLLLSVACARGSNAGWQRFYVLYRKYLSDLSRHLLARHSDAEELSQTIWIDLFLPDRSGQSRIASYDGRSSLATWLRVVVSNRVINERQRKGMAAGNLDAIPEPADPGALQDVEANVCRERYRDMILSAFEGASCRLEPQERLIVLLRYDQGLQLGEIARLFSVHQSTITRQLDRVVNRLRGDVVSQLSVNYGLDGAAIDECLSVACDTFSTSVSILSFLKEYVFRDPAPVAYTPDLLLSKSGGFGQFKHDNAPDAE
jgi:RNA polymerase sigma-70 factor